ncbi:hypothetical protein D3C78_1498130 [compost metagenome]
MFFALQQVDQIDRGVEAHPLVVLRDAGHGQRCRQVRFPRPRAADEHHVLRGIRKRQTGQLLDQASVGTGDAEIEARQVTVHGELGHVHLVAHGAYGAVGMLLFEEMFEQPLG